MNIMDYQAEKISLRLRACNQNLLPIRNIERFSWTINR